MILRSVLVLLVCLCPLVVQAAGEMTQREWMERLVDSLGWTYGLPDEPKDEDYLLLLSGQRSLRLEAESQHAANDRVAIKRFANFGDFSGEGWVSGLLETSRLQLPFLLPHGGRYQLSVAARMAGVKLLLDGKEYPVAGSDLFERHELGEIILSAGPHEIVIELPPTAGIDYVELSAAPLPAIAPLAGWQPDSSIATADMALTVLQTLILLDALPPAGRSQDYEAEKLAPAAGLLLVRDRHLGIPSGGAWLRASHLPVSLSLPLHIPKRACYQLVLRGSSESVVTARWGEQLSARFNFGPSLAQRTLGGACLPQGNSPLRVELPPWAGLDSLRLTELDSSSAQLARLIGFPGQNRLTAEQANQLLSLLSSLVY